LFHSRDRIARAEPDDLRLSASNEAVDVFGPQLKRLPLLGGLESAVVDASHPGLMP